MPICGIPAPGGSAGWQDPAPRAVQVRGLVFLLRPRLDAGQAVGLAAVLLDHAEAGLMSTVDVGELSAIPPHDEH